MSRSPNLLVELEPLGDRAFLARLDSEDWAHRWAEAVRDRAIPGVVEVTLAYASAAVFVDVDRVDPAAVEEILHAIVPGEGGRSEGRSIALPVLYDGADLAEAAARLGLTELEVVQCHSRREYVVFAIGFLPGFPYAGYLDEPLSSLPRRPTPRPKVPAGSVAVAARQTGVYPGECPGGWWLLGRTPSKIVDLAAGFFPIRAGDRLRFVPIDEGEFRGRLGEPVGLVSSGDPG